MPNYKNVINDVYKSELDDDDKKFIVNKTTGLMEMKYNKRNTSKCFDDYGEAYYYKKLNGGDIIPLYDYEYETKIDDYDEEYEHRKITDKIYSNGTFYKIKKEIDYRKLQKNKSDKLKKMDKINAHKEIFSILKDEMKTKIHALEIEIQ